MAVQQYIDILARRKWLVLLVVLVTVAVAAIGSALQQPTYTASVTVRVSQASSGSSDYAEYYYAERLLKTYVEIVKSRPFLAEAINRLNLSITPESLLKRIKVDVVLNTELIKVSVDDAQPANAAAIANILASLLVERSQDVLFGGARSARAILEEQLTVAEDNLERDRGALQALLNRLVTDQERIDELTNKIRLEEEIYANLLKQYEDARISEATRANSVTITEPAVEPRKPSKPRLILNIVLGLLLGLCAGLALAFLVETLDVGLHTIGDLEAVARTSVVGVLPEVEPARRNRRQPQLLTLESNQPGTEAYRLLRARIFAGAQGRRPKTLLVTSPEAGVGKTTVSANLAAVAADAGQRVIVVDADLRRPCLHEFFGLTNEFGLSDLLQGSASVDVALQSMAYKNLQLLATGPLPPNPAELLGSARMAEIIGQLAARADVVLVDSPPLLAVADGALLAPRLDSVLLVTARDETTGKRVETAYQLLEKVGAHVLGVVFNKAQGDERYYYYRYPARPKPRRGLARIAPAAAVVGGVLLVLAVLLGAGWLLNPPWLQSIPWLGPLISSATAVPVGPPVAPVEGDSGAPAAGSSGESSTLAAPTATPGLPASNTAQPDGASEPVVAATRTPLLPRPAFIASAAQGLSDGVFLYDDPITAVPGRVWLPSGSPIEVLEVDIFGRVYYGTRRWHMIQSVLDGKTYVGYVPAAVVTWTP